MTPDVDDSGEEVRGSRTLLANAFTVPARAALAAPLALRDKGPKVPDSHHFSVSD